MNPSTLFGMLIGDLYYGKRNSKAEDGILGMNVKKRTWFKEKQFRSHWGEKTCFLAFKIQVFPCPVRSLGLLKEKVKVKSLTCVRLFETPWTVSWNRLLHIWDFLGKSTGVGCHFLLQGHFLIQGLDSGLLHCRQTLYHMSHLGLLPNFKNVSISEALCKLMQT